MNEPHCPARLARFRLELDAPPGLPPAEPQTPLPCSDSSDRPGRCVHCYQAIERAAGGPHGPYCTGDSRCRECARLQREARARVFPATDPVLWSAADAELAAASEQFRDAPTPPPPPAAAELPAALLEKWRSDADRWQRLYGNDPEIADIACQACQRIATLIAALLDAREQLGAIGAEALARAAELETRLDTIRVELTTLNDLHQRRADDLARWRSALLGGGRAPFSSPPVEFWCPSRPGLGGKCERDSREAVCRWCNRALA